MPISVDRFKHLDEDSTTLAEGTNAHDIMSFLVAHPDEAFRRSELLDQTEVKEGSIGPTLQRLHERGLVRHRQNYWTLGHEERLGQVAGLTSTFAAINRHYEPETREDWFDSDE
jgi:transcription initiation factor IIE alpha subunit